MKKTILILLFLLFIINSCNNQQTNQEQPSTTLQKENTQQIIETRSFYMGFVPIPQQPLTTDSWLEAFDLFKENADFIVHHTPPDWSQFTDSSDTERNQQSTPNLESTNFISELSKLKGLKLFLVIDPLRSDREEIDQNLPSSIGTNFKDEKVRNAFKNYALRVAKDYKPEYLALGSEVNTYINKYPEDADNLISLYKETYDLIKKEFPNIKITTTLQYESLNGISNNNPNLDIIEKFEPKLDVVAITTYPSPWFETPDKLPDNYYTQIKKYTNKPIIIAESGWPTSGEERFHASQENQDKFLKKLVELTKDLDLELLVWWFPHDWAGSGYADYFKSMGLRTSDGKEKLAWSTWNKIHDLPKK